MAHIGILRESHVKYSEWSIPNFFDLPTNHMYSLFSPVFSLSDGKWFIKVYPNCTTGDNVYLLREPTGVKHRITFTVGIKNNDGSDVEVQTAEKIFYEGMCGDNYINYNFRFKELSSKEVLSLDGTLTIFYSLRIMNRPLAPSTLESATQTLSEGTSTLSKDFQDMYYSSLQSDLKITVQNKDFRAHRNVLSSRSSVFKSMLSHDMMEKTSGNIDIPDGDPDTFEDFLLFLYTGKFDNLSSRNAVSLYSAADKYDVKELKDECVRCMIDELSDDVFCDVLHLATVQIEKDLLKAVTDYFINNAKTIVLTTKWHTFLVEHPVVANELFYKQLISKNNMEK